MIPPELQEKWRQARATQAARYRGEWLANEAQMARMRLGIPDVPVFFNPTTGLQAVAEAQMREHWQNAFGNSPESEQTDRINIRIKKHHKIKFNFKD